jgi:hypothetical protein
MAKPERSTTASVPDRSPDRGRSSPGRAAGSEAYRSQAGRYDQRTDAFRRWRELVVARLPARSGDTVDRPWRLLAGFVPDLQVTELGAGGGYLAVGHARGSLDTTEQ